jgi:hypothetical protein
MQRAVLFDDLKKFRDKEYEERETKELDSITKQKIGLNCIDEMIEYTKDYTSREKSKTVPETLIVLNKDLEILTKLRETLDMVRAEGKDKQLTYSIEDLEKEGISKCTILVGLQRLYLARRIQETARSRFGYSRGDKIKYNLVPGQHLYYYGAFTGSIPGIRKANWATHHFVYLGKGLIIEVGSDTYDKDPEKKRVCLDEPSWRKVLENPSQYYKKNMNYVGITTFSGCVKFAMDIYGEEGFYLYEYPNDNDKDVILNRLRRARKIIGKWAYHLLSQNNCENAANYISIGESISTQACLSDVFYNSVAVTAEKIGEGVVGAVKLLTLPITYPIKKIFGSDDQEEIDKKVAGNKRRYYWTYEGENQLKLEIPRCVKDNTQYAPRILSDKSFFCKGSKLQTKKDKHGKNHKYCVVDKEYCKAKDCPDEDVVSDNEVKLFCKLKKGGFKNIGEI